MKQTQTRRERVSLCLWLTLSLAVAAAIYCLSDQPAEQSAELSGGFVERVLTALVGQAGVALVGQYQHLARKAAHFAIYFLLGLCLTGALRHQRRLPRLPAAIGAGTLYAALDELHQRFVPGRGPQVTDVLLDACGVAAGALLMTWLLWLVYRKKEP